MLDFFQKDLYIKTACEIKKIIPVSYDYWTKEIPSRILILIGKSDPSDNSEDCEQYLKYKNIFTSNWSKLIKHSKEVSQIKQIRSFVIEEKKVCLMFTTNAEVVKKGQFPQNRMASKRLDKTKGKIVLSSFENI